MNYLKMNDNILIQAFDKYRSPNCIVEVLYDEDYNRTNITLGDISNLLHRQQRELEMNRIAFDYANGLTVEKMKENKDEILKSFENSIKAAKVEAYREFAEKLMEEIGDPMNTIRNLLEEMERETL